MTDPKLTPPPELVQQWLGTYYGTTVIGEVSEVELALATQAAQYGADQELEACCEWMSNRSSLTEELRAARRPKPPSLKEQALMALEDGDIGHGASLTSAEVCIIRRALESIHD